MEVINYQTILAWRCPHCGKLDKSELSIFNFSGQAQVNIDCDCGSTKLNIGKKNENSYWLEYFCILCETRHLKIYNKYDFWAPATKKIKCPQRKTELGYLGRKTEIDKLVTEEQEYWKQTKNKIAEQVSLRKLKKIEILEGVVKALNRPSFKR